MHIRPFTDDDWPQFVCFAEVYFGQSHPTDRHFNEYWFKHCRFPGWAAQVLEDENGRLAGVQMEIVAPAKFGNQSLDMYWLSNTAVTEEVQSKGGGALLLLWAHKKFPLIAVTSTNDISGPLQDKLAVSVDGLKMRRFIKLLDRRVLDLCPDGQTAPLNALLRTDEEVLAKGIDLSLRQDVPDDYDQLWGRFREAIYCTTERWRPYMEWRYSAPYINYAFIEIRENGTLRGLAALRLEPTPIGPAGRILDFVADEEFASEVWKAAALTARQQGALFVDFMVIGSCQDVHLANGDYLAANEVAELEAIPHLLSPVEQRRWTNTFHMSGHLAKSDTAWRKPEAVYFTKGDGDRDWPTTYYLGNLRGQA